MVRLAQPLLGFCKAAMKLPLPDTPPPASIPAGDWTPAAPLWGEIPCFKLHSLSLDRACAHSGLPSTAVKTLGTAVMASQLLTRQRDDDDVPSDVWVGFFLQYPRLKRVGDAKLALSQVFIHTPADWRPAAVPSALTPLIPPEAPLRALTAGVSWPGRGDKRLLLGALRVRNVTPMLLDTRARDDKLAAHYARAHATPRLPPALAAAPALEILNLLRRMTLVRVHNKRSEAVRRLIFNAVLSADRRAQGLHPCVCGAAAPGLEHFFWSCPIADAVVRSIAAEVGGAEGTFNRPALWLASAPEGVCAGVWDAVCLLALSAI